MVLLYVNIVEIVEENVKTCGDLEISRCEVNPDAADASQCRPGVGKTRVGRGVKEGDSLYESEIMFYPYTTRYVYCTIVPCQKQHVTT